MLKFILKILKYTGILLLVLFVAIVITCWYLYESADMLTPVHKPTNRYELIYAHQPFRAYGPNMLRQSESGLWELYVEGDAFERGEAIGKLSSDLLYFQERAFVEQIREIVPSENYLKFLRYFIAIFNRNLGENVPEEYRDEIYGISLSCTDEYDFIGTPYERQLNYHAAHDLGHAMQDYMLVECTSFASWGKNSADSSLIVGRNFDFFVGHKFARNKVVSFYKPQIGYKFASIGWAGMTGVLSGMNEHGLTVTINAAKSDMPTSSATPISVLTREILQYATNIAEAYDIATKRKTFVAESILIGSAQDGKAVIIEKSPDKIALFTGDGNTQLLCTNHYQSEAFATDERNIENIQTSDSPYRFMRLSQLLNRESPMDYKKAATILRDHKGVDDEDIDIPNEWAINQFIAHHSVIFKPEQKIMWVSTSPWQSGKYVAYDLNKIFSDSLSFDREIYSEELSIPEDTFTRNPEFLQLFDQKGYRKLKEEPLFERFLPKNKTTITMDKNPHIQFLPVEEIKAYQEKQLAKQLMYLQQNSRFYQRMFAENQIDISPIKTLEDLQKLPATTKTDLQLYNEDFICVDKEEIIDYVTTSGTLGNPVTFALTDEDLTRLSYNEVLSFTTAGCTRQDILQLMTTLDRRFMAGLAYYMGARELGMGVARVGNGIPELQWDTINRIHPSWGMVVPSFLIKLIEFAEKNNIDYHNSSLRKCVCIGEALRNQDFTLNTLGRRIHEKWPELQLHSTYASTEMQSSFTECSMLQGGHLQPELIIIEFLDDNNQPVAEGEPGEVTITTLGVKGMPLLRFKMGDICYHHKESCGCGRNTMRLSPVIGRKGQMIKYKGTTLYPPALFDILDSIHKVINYVVEVYTNDLGTDEILIRVASEDRSDIFAKEIKDLFRSKVRVAPTIAFESAEYIAKIQLPPMSRKTIKFIDLR